MLLLGHLVLLVAGGVIAGAVRAAGTGFGAPELPGRLVGALLLAAAVGATALAVSATRDDGAGLYWALPAVALVAVDRRAPSRSRWARPHGFRVALLVGWLAGAPVAILRYGDLADVVGAPSDARATVWVGAAVAVLVPLGAVMAWTARGRP